MNLFDIRTDGAGREIITPTVLPPAPEEPPVEPELMDEPDAADEAQAAIVLRPYQQQAVERIYQEWNGWTDSESIPHEPVTSTLLVVPTGGGKNVIASAVIRQRPPGRAMFIAHRKELVNQSKATIEAVTGAIADVEMADLYAGNSDVVVATVQSLCSGMGGDGRMIAFKPEDFSLVIMDEAHRSTADTWSRVHAYFKANTNLKVLGMTATPDRADEEALGTVFQSVAFDYELPDAIKDGWLVPIVARSVAVAGLDYSSIRTTAGDLNGADLAAVLEFEDNLHRIASPTIELVGDRKALVFAATVVQAERLCEIFNRHKPNMAQWVCAKTPPDDRDALFANFKAGRFTMLVNVGICTEGWDEPTVEVIVLARPTKSRCLFSQMVGRGTRALPGVVDGPPTPELRRAAIAASAKTTCEVIDFVGNTGRHRLVSTADILGGNYDDDVIDRARKIAEKANGAPVDVAESLEEAQRQADEQKRREAARRAKLKVRANYQVSGPINPFELLGVTKYRERGWERGKPITEKMQACLERNGLWEDGMTFTTARQLIQGMVQRREKHLCTIKQAQLLAKHGFPPSTTFDEARKIIDTLAQNRWQWPKGIPKPGQPEPPAQAEETPW